MDLSLWITILQIAAFIHLSSSNTPRRKQVSLTSLNTKAVGVSLKANDKKYFISGELCPGGIFLTKAVNEDCLCYNGIFQIVRDCCTASKTRIHTDTLEWRMDYKCGTSPDVGKTGANPIRAILPLTKPLNRMGSVITLRSVIGNKTSQWRKYDTDDIIIKNYGRLTLRGKSQFEIINIKPLGREIRIRFGPHSNTVVCYRGWSNLGAHQTLRVHTVGGGTPGPTQEHCCLNITKENTPGLVTSDCTSGSVKTEIIDVQSVHQDTGTCKQQSEDDTQHSLRKRKTELIQFRRTPYGKMQTFRREVPSLGYAGFGSMYLDDLVGARGSILVKRQTEPSEGGSEDGDSLVSSYSSVIDPRRRGISTATFKEQALAINEFVAILRNDPNVELRPPQTYRFKLLKKAFDVFLKVIPNEIVPHVMLKTAFDVFYFLYEELDPFMNPPPEMFNKAFAFLDNCESMEQVLNFTTSGCPREIDRLVVDSFVMKKLETYYESHPEDLERAVKSLDRIEIRKDRRFIPELHDIFVEINWKVADFTHSFCFEHFGNEFNAHHFFESELETIFLLPEVQKRWFSRVEDLKYVRGLFATSNLNLRMKQLDKVATVGHSLSRYNGSYWLYRPNSYTLPWFINPSGGDSKTTQGGEPGLAETDQRLAFAQNMIQEKYSPIAGEAIQSRTTIFSSELDRKLIYPFIIPEKLPAGELIWDGLAVCLHAHYSNRRRYFLDSDLWGVTPSLQHLGQLYIN